MLHLRSLHFNIFFDTQTRLLKWIIATFRPYRWRVLLIMALVLLSVACSPLVPEVTRLIIDQALPGKNYQQLLFLSLVLAIIPVITGLISLANDYLNISLGQSVMHDIRVRLYSHLQSVSMRFYTRERTGEIISRLTNDINGIEDVVTSLLRSTLSNALTLVMLVVVMFSLNWLLTLLTLALIPLFILLAQRVGKVVRQVSIQKQQALSYITTFLEETLNVSGALLIKSFARQQAISEQLLLLSQKLVRVQVRQTMISRQFLLGFHIFFNALPALIYYTGGLQVTGGKLSLGTLIAFLTLQINLFPTIRSLLTTQVEIQQALALFERLFAYLDLPVEIRNGVSAIVLSEVQGKLRFRHVSFGYEARGSVLHDIDFVVQPGQLVALVGASGAGKTTIMQLVLRLYDVDEGSIEINDIDVRALDLMCLGRYIGIVSQETYLLNTTIRENIAYGRPEARFEEVVEAAKIAQIHDRIEALPQGYDTLVGPRGYTLSGGEKQRIAIARTLLKNPRLLLLDEATSSLDTRTEQDLQQALTGLQRGRTTLIIAHRLSTILAADVILVLDKGRIIEKGTHAELLQLGGAYTQLYQAGIKNNIMG